MASKRRQAIARQLASLFPETIINRLTADRSFRKRNGLRQVATMTFQGSDAVFSRETVIDAVRRVFKAGAEPQMIKDRSGAEWTIAWDDVAGCPVKKKDDVEIPLAMLWPHASDDETRRSFMEQTFDQNRAVGADFDAWREYLTRSPLDAEDFDTFQSDLHSTPVQVALGVRSGLSKGSSNTADLTPDGSRYYERLVGPWFGSETLSVFAAGPAKLHVASLIDWSADKGLVHALLSGAHSSLIPELPDGYDLSILERILTWLAQRGDRISQVTAFELGLRHLKARPSFIDSLVSIAEQIRDDDPEDQNGRLLLLANLFIFVDGSVAHMGHLRNVPPFWRRLATIAQASLIEREFVSLGIAPRDSTAWMKSGRGAPFYLQSSIDGQREPRWIPDFATPAQWKSELISRLILAAERNAEAIDGTAFEGLIRGTEAGSIRSQLKFPYSYLPGPLEGGLDSLMDAPEEIVQVIRESVEVATTDPNAFNALVNSCLVFRTPAELAQQAAEAIKKAKYRVRDNTETGKNFGMLSGLALVAASTRSVELAEEVRILTRVALRRTGSELNPLDSFRIAMVAANAFEDAGAWRKFLGEWVTELAFRDLTREEALRLHESVQVLCDLEPAMWATLSRAEAALGSYINAA
jgi:hypothetical protein